MSRSGSACLLLVAVVAWGCVSTSSPTLESPEEAVSKAPAVRPGMQAPGTPKDPSGRRPDFDWPDSRVQEAAGPFPIHMAEVPPGIYDPNNQLDRQKRRGRPDMPIPEELAEILRLEALLLPPDGDIQSLQEGGVSRAPTPGVSFDSISAANCCGGGLNVPPDPELAVGPNHIIAVVNVAFEIYDKSGNVLQASTTFSSFFAGTPGCSNTGVFDPNVLYDEKEDRFILGIDGNGTDYCVAATQTGNPLGLWNRYGFATGSASIFFDFPHAGVGNDAIYMGSNQFSNITGNFLEGRVFAMDKFDMYSGASLTVVDRSTGGDSTPQPMKLQGWAQGTWPAVGNPHYILTDDVFNGATYAVWSWDDPFGTNTLTKDGAVNLNAFTGVTAGFPIDVPQTGSSADVQANDWRVQDAEYRNGMIWMSNTMSCNPGGGTVDCVRWAQIDPTGPSIVDAGVFASSGEYRFFPNVAANHCDGMAIGYTKGSASTFYGVYVTGREATDTPGSVQAETLVKAGEVAYSSFANDPPPHRWGDYTGMTIDPDGETFWYLGEYAKNVGVQSKWGTYIGSFSFGSCSIGCVDDTDCDDGAFCNGNETCDQGTGQCVPGTPPTCDDGVACTVDSCDVPTDSCVNTPNDGFCSNGVFCDGAETCHATLGCQAGTPPSCDDGVGCTDDSCNVGTDSCDNIPNDANCDDGAFCNGAETCHATLDCQAGSDPCPGQSCNETLDICEGGSTAQLEGDTVTVGGTPVTVNLTNTYISPVVVATAQYDNNTTPVVTRVSNVTPTSFDVRLQNPSNGGVAAETVSYLVVEEGTWTIDGVAVEAQSYSSSVTDDAPSNWVGNAQSYGQGYTSPVVLGQVMSENDPDFSVFWDKGTSRGSPPTASTLVTGKTVCEDTDTTRAAETVGFIVIEAGHGTIGGVEYESALGADTVRGAGDGPPYTYTFNTAFATAPTVAVATMAAVDGNNGGWAQIHGPTMATATSLFLSIDEDQIGDSERNHTTEQVGYVAFAGAVTYPVAPQCVDDGDCDDGAFCNGAETCNAGTCEAGTPPTCDDGVSCTVDSCNEGTDSCDFTPNDGLCDNGLFCDGAETCHQTLGCQAGTAPDCSDPVACTIDSCNEGTDSCDNVPDDSACDNGQFCDGAEFCDQVAGCQAGTAPDCTDPFACTIDSCNEGTDSCDNVPDDALCDDGAFCNGAETCSAATGCEAGTPPVCDDGVGCTDDSCNEGTDSCDFVANDLNCNDTLFCNGVETCHPTLDCQPGTPVSCPPGETCNETTDMCEPPAAQAQLEWGSVTAGGTAVTVNLVHTYVSPVVVATAQYANNTTPIVTRVSNVTGTSFDVRLQNPSGGAVASENISYLVVEEGTWTVDGVPIEAQTYLSSVTDENNSWGGEPQSYGQSYTSPVVLGQVMSESDPDWSVFWDRGTNRSNPPSPSTLFTGKTVCEDSDTTRADEVIGFIVFEADHGTIGGVEFESRLGADTIRGVGNSPPYAYDFLTAFAGAPTVALTTMAAMDGVNGGWAQVHGATMATAASIFLSIDEDQVNDSERRHTTEQVSYVVFASPGSTP